MHDDIQRSYDQVPYESLAIIETYPDRIAALATLFGMRPAPPGRCRVLELGCASGGNLIPMAVALPGSSFVGVDLSPRQVADGQQIISELKLTNIKLKALDICTIGPDFGEFDYLICHGVWSWVPAAVQNKIFEICVRNLAPDGVAFISYNTYPGWHQWGVARDLMRYAAREVADPAMKARQARAFLEFVAQAASPATNPEFRQNLARLVKALGDKSDSYLLHEFLEEINEPVYFHQFIERAKACGLQYLAEARQWVMGTNQFPREVEQALNQAAGSLLQREQWLDFLNNQSFRRSLLCRPQAPLNRTLKAEALTLFRIASLALPANEVVDIGSSRGEMFVCAEEGLEITTPEPLLKSALVHLAEVSPWSVPFDELLKAARARLGLAANVPDTERARDVKILGARLLNCYLAGIVELSVRSPSFVPEASPRPIASMLARWQAPRIDHLTNLRHESIRVPDFARRLLPLLDGQRDRAALAAAIGSGAEGDVEETLGQLARGAFLIG